MAIGFYALGALDILGLVESKTSEADRENWRAWMWAQQSSLSVWFFARVCLHLRILMLRGFGFVQEDPSARDSKAART